MLIEREKAEELFTDDEYKKLEKLENVKAVNRVAEVQLYPMDFKIITKSESVDADNQKLRIMAYDNFIVFYFYFTFSNIMYKAKKNFSRNGGIT